MTDDTKQILNALRKMTSLTRQLVVLDIAQTALKATQEGQDYSAVLRALADYASAQGCEDSLEQATFQLEQAMFENLNRSILKTMERGRGDEQAT